MVDGRKSSGLLQECHGGGFYRPGGAFSLHRESSWISAGEPQPGTGKLE
jgi:hypothetical protein